MTNGAGASLNPALGFAQSIYMIGVENQGNSTQGSRDAKYIWVYMLFPYVGAFIAAFFYRMHDYIEKNEYKQNQPMQFVGLLKHSDPSPLLTGSRIEQAQVADRSQVWQQLHNSNSPDSRNHSIDSMAIANNLNPPVAQQPVLLDEDALPQGQNQAEQEGRGTVLESRPAEEETPKGFKDEW